MALHHDGRYSSINSLPLGVSSTTKPDQIPNWIFPTVVDLSTLFKPDLVIFENLPTDEAKYFDILNTVALENKLSQYKQIVRVHVIELTSNYSKVSCLMASTVFKPRSAQRP